MRNTLGLKKQAAYAIDNKGSRMKNMKPLLSHNELCYFFLKKNVYASYASKPWLLKFDFLLS